MKILFVFLFAFSASFYSASSSDKPRASLHHEVTNRIPYTEHRHHDHRKVSAGGQETSASTDSVLAPSKPPLRSSTDAAKFREYNIKDKKDLAEVSIESENLIRVTPKPTKATKNSKKASKRDKASRKAMAAEKLALLKHEAKLGKKSIEKKQSKHKTAAVKVRAGRKHQAEKTKKLAGVAKKKNGGGKSPKKYNSKKRSYKKQQKMEKIKALIKEKALKEKV